MKQYTDKDQTAKLIELGFPKPKFSFPIEDNEHPDYVDEEGIPWSLVEIYSIGELIEFLPVNGTRIKNIEFDGLEWFIDWDSDTSIYQKTSSELIDALFNMCVTLKEEGVI